MAESPLVLAVVAAVAGGGCARPSTAGEPAPGQLAQQPQAAVSADQSIGQVRKLVTSIAAAPQLTKAQVEALIGARLGPSREFPDDPHHFEALLPDGPFSRVDFREPKPQQANKRWILVLDVRDGVQLPLKAFDKGFIGPMTDVNPNIPPEGTITHSVDGPAAGRSTRFQFRAKSQTLRLVAFHREASR